jgi:transketolase
MDELVKKASLVRKWSLIATTEAASGHPTSCLSAADLTTVLFDKYFSYNLKDPHDVANDRFVLSKGHAAPLLYTLFALSGAYPLEDLKTLRKLASPYEGHPTPEFPFAEAATGSLGQGLSVAAGLAYYGKKNGINNKVYCLLGDGELAEGQVWEAANFASYYNLDNLIAIADINRLGQSQQTMFGHHIEEYMGRFRSFGFEVIGIDGHDLSEIDAAFQAATTNTSEKPYIIIAKTFKGNGISFLKDNEHMHGKALKKEELEKALQELGEVDDTLRFSLKHPHDIPEITTKDNASVTFPAYNKGDELATREAYGVTLAALGATDKTIYALDGDMKNSTFSQDFLKAHPERFIECFIAEQNMVGVAVGLSRLKQKPFVSTFAAFLTRAADQIRMAAVSKASIRFVGAHVGVSIGEDGASQMGLEDIAIFGAIPDSVILQPADITAMTQLLKKMASHDGISYIRMLRPKTQVIYEAFEEFVIGGSKVLTQSAQDVLTVAASGITVPEALKAYEELQKHGIFIRVVDCYSVKPVDRATLLMCAEQTTKRAIITVEDHFDHGGLGDIVLAALAESNIYVHKIAVTKIAHSGTTKEVLDATGINASHIVATVKAIAGNQ